MRYVLPVVMMMMMVVVGVVRADEATEGGGEAGAVKKGVEAFVTAWQSGDAKAMQEALVIPAGKEKDFETVLEAVAAISRLQKTAQEKFGNTATEYFANASEQFAARMKAIQEGTIKITGDSAVLTIAANEAAKTRGGTLVLVKKSGGGGWKIDAGTLFDVTPSLVSSSKLLTTVADGIADEIKKNKYAAAVDAYQEFNARYAAALKTTTETPSEK